MAKERNKNRQQRKTAGRPKLWYLSNEMNDSPKVSKPETAVSRKEPKRAMPKRSSMKSLNDSFPSSFSSFNNSLSSLGDSSVTFSTDVDVVSVPRLPIEELENLFYEEEDFAQFRYVTTY